MKKKKITNNKETFLTAVQAADFLNISVSTLKKYIYSNNLKTLKTPGGHYRIRESDLLGMLQ